MKLLPLILGSILLSSWTYQRSDEDTTKYAIENLGLEKKRDTITDIDGDFIPDLNESSRDRSIFNYPRIMITETAGIEIDFNLNEGCSNTSCYIQKSSSENLKETNDIFRDSIKDGSFYNKFSEKQSLSQIKDQNYFPFIESFKGIQLNTDDNQPIIDILFNIEVRDIKYINRISNIVLEVAIKAGDKYLTLTKTTPRDSLGNSYYMINNGAESKVSVVPLNIREKLNLELYDLEKLRRLLLKEDHKIIVKVLDFDYDTEATTVNLLKDVLEDRLNPKSTKLSKVTFSSPKITRTEYMIPASIEDLVKTIYPDVLMNRTTIKELNLLEETSTSSWEIERYTSKKKYVIDIRKKTTAGQKILINYKTKRSIYKDFKEGINSRINGSEITVDNLREGDILDITLKGTNKVITQYPINSFISVYDVEINKSKMSQIISGELLYQESVSAEKLSSSIKILNEDGELSSVRLYYLKGNREAYLKNNVIRFRIEAKSEIIDNGSMKILIDDKNIRDSFYKNLPSSYKQSRLSPAQIEAERKKKLLEKLRENQDARDSRI